MILSFYDGRGGSYEKSFNGIALFDDGGYACCRRIGVVIGDSVTRIGEYAFSDCSSLTNVYYKGTASDWGNIDIYFDGNDYLTNATKYYYVESEEDVPTDGGNYWHYDKNGEIAIW